MPTQNRTAPVTIKFAKAGTQPPVYLAGSFSNPAWEPREMQHMAAADGETEYSLEVIVEEGKDYQYKFRMGVGDWWVLNEEAPTVTDSIGNRNNLLSVPTQTSEQIEDPSDVHTNGIPRSPKMDKITATDKEYGNDQLKAKPKHYVEDMTSSMTTTENSTSEDSGKGSENGNSPTRKKFPSYLQLLDTKAADAARQGARTPELANVAAEVADSAAILDRDQPTPPISDEEAGKIGYRRMSSTPIPQVAGVAAEVANTAATLDLVQPPAAISDEQAGSTGYRRMSNTPIPEVAATAYEVAESAAILDRSQSTPPISDAEAGKIGYRRMSNTPIPEVANTAAEVADVAAKLDRTKIGTVELPPAPINFEDDAHSDYAPTPEEERVPLFPHELPGPMDKIAQSLSDSQRNSTSPTPVGNKNDREDDLNDPTLLQFPTDREGVYAQILSLERQLPPDDSLPGTPPPASPAVGSSRSAERSDLANPSPKLLADQSPSLEAISEEHEHGEGALGALPKPAISRKSRMSISRSRSRSRSRSQSRSSLRNVDDLVPSRKKAPETSHEIQLAEQEQDPEGSSSAQKIAPVESNTMPTTGLFNVETIEGDSLALNDTKAVDTTRGISIDGQETKSEENTKIVEQTVDTENTAARTQLDERDSVTKDDRLPEAVDFSGPTSPMSDLAAHVTMPGDGSSEAQAEGDEPAPAVVHPTIEIEDVSSQGAEEMGGSSTEAVSQPNQTMLKTNVQAVLTPFYSGNDKQLGNSDQTRELLASKDGPSITLQSATPRSSLRNAETEPSVGRSSDESTGLVATKSDSVLTSRKNPRPISPVSDRPLTPSSIRSSHKDIKSRNFLKAFWRVVFVDWIGGFLMRLCGGERET